MARPGFSLPYGKIRDKDRSGAENRPSDRQEDHINQFVNHRNNARPAGSQIAGLREGAGSPSAPAVEHPSPSRLASSSNHGGRNARSALLEGPPSALFSR